jgi:hypothetical protein
MKLLQNNKFYLLTIILISIITKIYFSSNIYTETDDLLSVHQIKIYQNISIYDIANDKKSPTYNSDLKKKIRDIENLNNDFYNSLINFFSFVLKRVAPSKHATFAPLQYFLFTEIINAGNSYKEIKFFSRLPSIFFSILSVLITYIFAKNIFRSQNSFLPMISASFVAFSYPIMYISLRSYNYSAGIFAVTLFFYLIYINYNNQKNIFTISDFKISFKSSLIIGLTLSLLGYLSYVILFLSPLFFLILFFQKFLEKKLFSSYNYNLIITGLVFTIFMSPMLAYMLSLNVSDYNFMSNGVSQSPAGTYWEYYLDLKSDNLNLKDIFQFYIQNSYLVIVKNLSFFTDLNFYSNFLQSLLLIFFFTGLFYSHKLQDKNIRNFLNIFIIFIVYYFILVLLGFVTLGPTRHLNSYTPLLAIISSLGIYNLLAKFKKITLNLNLVNLIIILIFCMNLFSFNKNYKDAFDEDLIVKEIKNSKISLIFNHASFSDSICIMDKVYALVTIATCPIKHNRYTYKLEMNDKDLKFLKDNNLSLALINKKLSNNEILLIKKHEFKLKKIIKNIKFTDNSPLYISKYVPNFFIMEIYK